jgi:hypothetical protein
MFDSEAHMVLHNIQGVGSVAAAFRLRLASGGSGVASGIRDEKNLRMRL